MDHQPPYDPAIYAFVFNKILKHRHFVPLHVTEVFPVLIDNENDLHHLDSLFPDAPTANAYAKKIAQHYPNQSDIDALVGAWYLT